MNLELLEAHQLEQLSACRNSLTLGVFSDHNKIERYLRVARAVLNVDKAIFAFQSEPYMWVATPEDDFKPYIAVNSESLSPYFDGELIISQGHKNYQKLFQLLKTYGLSFERLLCCDFKLETGESVGQIIFYDTSTEDFTEKQKNLLIELTSDLTTILEDRNDSQYFYELYEEERALNFSKTKFFQIIAHDLRAPFHGLIGFTDVLANERETLDERSVEDIVHYLHDTLQSTYCLLENLLNWAMAEGGRFVYHPIHFKLKQTTKIVFDVLNSLAIKKNIELIEDVDDRLMVYADMNMITSIIQNLVSNALKFTHTDGTGRVVISAKQIEQNVEISIHDTGLGMSQSQIEKVFEPHINVSLKGTTGEQGTGLGLVLCKRFVDLNHGQIFVNSENGCGTTFTVVLPVTKAFEKISTVNTNLEVKA